MAADFVSYKIFLFDAFLYICMVHVYLFYILVIEGVGHTDRNAKWFDSRSCL